MHRKSQKIAPVDSVESSSGPAPPRPESREQHHAERAATTYRITRTTPRHTPSDALRGRFSQQWVICKRRAMHLWKATIAVVCANTHPSLWRTWARNIVPRGVLSCLLHANPTGIACLECTRHERKPRSTPAEHYRGPHLCFCMRASDREKDTHVMVLM